MPRAAIVGAVHSTEVAAKAVIDAPDWDLQAVVSLPAELAHRHSDYCDLSSLCEEAGARFVETSQINDAATLEQIRECDLDLLLVIGWSQLCGPEFRQILPGRTLGYHPAALPRLRGRAAIPWTILSGDPITAGTIFHLADGADTGDIVAQKFFHLGERETAKSLYEKHMRALERLVPETLALAGDCSGAIVGSPQDDAYATYGARRTPEDGRIDWTARVDDIDRLVRAVGEPYPGAFAMLGDARLIVHEAVPHSGAGKYAATPGQIVAIDGTSLLVRTVDGLLEVKKWDVAGEKAPKAGDRLS